jgi:hypothetical protein
MERLAALAQSPGWADLLQILADEEQTVLAGMRQQKDTQSLLFWTRYWQQFCLFRDALITEPEAAAFNLSHEREEAEARQLNLYVDPVFRASAIIELEPE